MDQRARSHHDRPVDADCSQEGAMRNSRLEFVREQGYSTHEADDRLYSALMLQPRIIGALVVLGMLLQSTWLFVALSAVLW
jgi:hypothetical protein